MTSSHLLSANSRCEGWAPCHPPSSLIQIFTAAVPVPSSTVRPYVRPDSVALSTLPTSVTCR